MIAPAGKQLTFRLRAAKFHNGDPVTSSRRQVHLRPDPEHGQKAVARALFADVEQMDAPDPRTVVFQLKQPNVTLLTYMAHRNASIVSPQGHRGGRRRPVQAGARDRVRPVQADRVGAR